MPKKAKAKKQQTSPATMSRNTRHQIEFLVQAARSHSYYLKKIVEMLASDDKEQIKKLADELGSSADQLQAAIEANTPKEG